MTAKHDTNLSAIGTDIKTAGPNSRVVGYAITIGRGGPRAHANARLWAAAPDMLMALETIALHAPSLDAEGIRELCDAAIAKAKVGGSND